VLRLLEAPKSEPVSVDELKRQCRIEHDHENTLLRSYITAARQYCEGVINYKISRQKWTLCLERFESKITIHLGPVISIDAVRYYDGDNAIQTLDTSAYRSAIGTTYTLLSAVDSWPTTSTEIHDAVQIDITCGKAQPLEHHKHAILMIAAGWYKNREDISDLDFKKTPNGADALLGITNNQVF
jgi:uncharacterized phiE125 gp8 family phage protein